MRPAVEHHGPTNLQVFAPRQLDGASIAVDGKQTSALTPGDPLLDEALVSLPGFFFARSISAGIESTASFGETASLFG